MRTVELSGAAVRGTPGDGTFLRELVGASGEIVGFEWLNGGNVLLVVS